MISLFDQKLCKVDFQYVINPTFHVVHVLIFLVVLLWPVWNLRPYKTRNLSRPQGGPHHSSHDKKKSTQSSFPQKQENGSEVIFHVGNDRPKWAPQQYFYSHMVAHHRLVSEQGFLFSVGVPKHFYDGHFLDSTFPSTSPNPILQREEDFLQGFFFF